MDALRSVLVEPNVRATIGCHPHWADRFDSRAEHLMLQMLDEPGVIGVGETGLDYSV
jgi:Tat protein secretion system quality control protein TatD with DNase activity